MSIRKTFRPSTRAASAGRALLLAVVFAVTLAPGAWAQEMTAGRKAGRGLAGITLGVLEIPGNIVQETRTNGGFSGATVGLGVGLGKFVARELIGVYELLSAPFPIPEGYQPVLTPEFPWQYFESEKGRPYGFNDGYLQDEERDFQQLKGAVVVRGRGALTVRFPSDLLFSLDSSTLGPAAKQRLNKVADTLNRHPDTQIQIRGYTDTSGSDDYNLTLSNARAASVSDYLIQRGVSADRIESMGFGPAGPIASNLTADGRRSNRRVEIQVRAGNVSAFR